MPARIRSTVNETLGGLQVGAAVLEASRADLRKNNEVVLESLDVATTYAWTLADIPNAPDGTASAATFLAPEGSNSSTARFVVDNEGSYLVRLVVDQGLPTEDVQFVRLAFKTVFGNLLMAAAGERRDQIGVIPVDASPKGWAGIQNQNHQRVLGILRRTATSGRVLYVDSNRGRNRSASANDATNSFELPGSDTLGTGDDITITAERHGDFSTIGEAIAYAQGAVGRGEPAASQESPWLIKVAPGLYTEDLVLRPFIHVMGDAPSQWASDGFGSFAVVVRAQNVGAQGHRFRPSSDLAQVTITNLRLENTDDTSTVPVMFHDRGFLRAVGCSFVQVSSAVGPGSALAVESAVSEPTFIARNCYFSDSRNNADTESCFKLNAPGGTVKLVDCKFESARTGVELNSSLYEFATGTILFDRCSVVSQAIGFRAYADVTFKGGHIVGSPATNAVVIDGFAAAPGSKPGSVTVELRQVDLTGMRVVVDESQAVGGVTVKTGGEFYYHVAVAAHTVTNETLIGVDSTTVGGPVTITLPAPSVAREVKIKDEVGGAAANNISVVTPGAETIDGLPSFTVTTNHGALSIYSDGTNWFIV